LEINRGILKAFIPNMRKFKRKFGAFVVARDVTHQFQEVRWKAGNIINFIQAIENALRKVTELQLTSILLILNCEVKSPNLKSLLSIST